MGQVRCEICHLRLPTSKNLIPHYLTEHSKFELAREILKLSILTKIPKSLKKLRKNKTDNGSAIIKSAKKAQTLFATESFQILYRNNEIIIRDDKSSVDMEFSFDEHSSESKENFFVPDKNKEIDTKLKNTNDEYCIKEVNNNSQKNNSCATQSGSGELERLLKLKNPLLTDVSTSSSSASSEDSPNRFSFCKRIRKRKDIREKTRHYKINITGVKDGGSLNENTGTFYQCHCREDNKKIVGTNQVKLTSDTESASDTGRNNDLQFFCKCGNGYKDKNELSEHMKIHETQCRVCNEIFPNEQEFKLHVQTHLFKVFVCHICTFECPSITGLHKHFECHAEDSILESVINMEEDYNVTPFSFTNMSYQSSINNILCYLKSDRETLYYNTNCNKMTKVFCDMCQNEVFYRDYESHVQTVHFGIYSYYK